MWQPSPEAESRYLSDAAACRGLLRGGSKTFFAASLLLPQDMRNAATVLYGFCRQADDAIDLGDRKKAALDGLQLRLDRAYAGNPLDTPVDRALAHVVAKYRLPRTLPDALLEGMAWDAEGRQYQDLSGLLDYAARVAGTVGAMMAVLMGARSFEAVSRACDLGVAMQLSNIARDVGEDARAGRLYLPRDWMQEASLDPDAWLKAPSWGDELAEVVERILAVAESLYERAESGIAGLDLGYRPAIFAARHLYAEIGHEVARRNCDSISQRAVVSSSTKARLLCRALADALLQRPSSSAQPLAETRYLVRAVSDMPTFAPAAAAAEVRMPPWWQVSQRVERMIVILGEVDQGQEIERSLQGR